MSNFLRRLAEQCVKALPKVQPAIAPRFAPSPLESAENGIEEMIIEQTLLKPRVNQNESIFPENSTSDISGSPPLIQSMEPLQSHAQRQASIPPDGTDFESQSELASDNQSSRQIPWEQTSQSRQFPDSLTQKANSPKDKTSPAPAPEAAQTSALSPKPNGEERIETIYHTKQIVDHFTEIDRVTEVEKQVITEKHSFLPNPSSFPSGQNIKPLTHLGRQKKVESQLRQSLVQPPEPQQTDLPVRKKSRSQPIIVQVSIGRVEVRSVAPSPPSKPAPRQAVRGPRYSLDDYLKERGG